MRLLVVGGKSTGSCEKGWALSVSSGHQDKAATHVQLTCGYVKEDAEVDGLSPSMFSSEVTIQRMLRSCSCASSMQEPADKVVPEFAITLVAK